MSDFYLKVFIYFVSFLIALFGLDALDFNRFLKKGRVAQAYVLYFVLAASLSYLLGNFLMSIIYYFH